MTQFSIAHTKQFNYLCYTLCSSICLYTWWIAQKASFMRCHYNGIIDAIGMYSVALSVFPLDADNAMSFNRYYGCNKDSFCGLGATICKIPADTELLDWILTNTSCFDSLLFRVCLYNNRGGSESVWVCDEFSSRNATPLTDSLSRRHPDIGINIRNTYNKFH